jgi:hypothetical protein
MFNINSQHKEAVLNYLRTLFLQKLSRNVPTRQQLRPSPIVLPDRDLTALENRAVSPLRLWIYFKLVVPTEVGTGGARFVLLVPG